MAAMSADAVATAIAELATPDGRYAVLGRIDFNALQGLTVPPTDLCLEARPNAQALNPLDTAWLQAVATVRPNLARLEVYQLERLLAGQSPPLFAWTNRPGDPWQVDVAARPGHQPRACHAPGGALWAGACPGRAAHLRGGPGGCLERDRPRD